MAPHGLTVAPSGLLVAPNSPFVGLGGLPVATNAILAGARGGGQGRGGGVGGGRGRGVTGRRLVPGRARLWGRKMHPEFHSTLQTHCTV